MSLSAKILNLRRGTTTEHSTFTGATAELTVDTTTWHLRLHDNSTVGGHLILNSGDNISLLTNDSSYQTATQVAASISTAVSGLIPTQSGNGDKYLCTNGTNTYWNNTFKTVGLFGTTKSITNTIDVSTGTVFTLTCTQDITLALTGVPTGNAACISLIITNGGNYTITYPSSFKWSFGEEPDLTINGTDIITLITSDGGTTWYASCANSFS